MICSKCSTPGYCKEVGANATFLVCYECSKLHRRMTETLRLEYVEKLKELEDFFFNSAKPSEPSKPVEVIKRVDSKELDSRFTSGAFIDDEELYEDVKVIEDPIRSAPLFDETLPEMIFG